jgi:hypothetical protein
MPLDPSTIIHNLNHIRSSHAVVALFNAIASAKKEAADEVSAKEALKKDNKAGMSDTNNKTNSKLSKQQQLKSNSIDSFTNKNNKFLNDDGFYDDKKGNKKDNSNKNTTDISNNDNNKENSVKTNWKALQDDYLIDNSKSIKVCTVY